MFSVKCVSVLVALVCLSVPSNSRSWGGNHDQKYDRFPQRSWIADSDDGQRHRSNHGWGHDFDSSDEESWESKEDYQDQRYGNDKYDNFKYHHDHERHNYDHHNHGYYGHHHHPGYKHYNSDGKSNYHGHHRGRSEPTLPPSSGIPQNHKDNAHNIRPTPAQNTGLNPKPAVPQFWNREPFSKNNADRVVFPEESPASKLSTTRSPVSSSSPLQPSPLPLTRPTVMQATQQQQVTTSTTISPLVLADIVRCIRDCPATPEFNPVCGTNNVTYNNLGALECTRNCGVNVALGRRAPCPQPLPPAFFISVPMLSTEQPIVNARADDNINNAPMAGSPGSAHSDPTTATKATVIPTRFTNIQSSLDSDFNIDKRRIP